MINLEESKPSETQSDVIERVIGVEDQETHCEEQTFTEQGSQFPAASNIETEDTYMEQIHLPPPPQQTFSSSHYRPPKKPLDFARVPSAHATLPAHYDGRLSNLDSFNDNSTIEPQIVVSGKISEPSTHKGRVVGSTKPKLQQINEGGVKLKKSDELIIRKFQKDSATPRFIPRQTIQAVKSKSSQEKSPENQLNKEIKKNAFTLGETQGPQISAAESQSAGTSETEKSFGSTTKEIRKRISKVGVHVM